ncbi:hypothetical protein DFH06DRAFT_1196126 [Mycena polygramma]|nr:hypothetical protein DFH06DRAFT_1196126 [Mycena polygramma]
MSGPVLGAAILPPVRNDRSEEGGGGLELRILCVLFLSPLLIPLLSVLVILSLVLEGGVRAPLDVHCARRARDVDSVWDGDGDGARKRRWGHLEVGETRDLGRSSMIGRARGIVDLDGHAHLAPSARLRLDVDCAVAAIGCDPRAAMARAARRDGPVVRARDGVADACSRGAGCACLQGMDADRYRLYGRGWRQCSI